MSSTAHLDRDLAFAMLSGTGEHGVRLARTLPHLIAGCPVCRSVWQEVEDELACASSGVRESLLERALAEHRAALSPRQERLLERQIRELLAHPPERQLAVVQGATKWFRDPLIAFDLLERARQAMPEEPSEAEHYSALAYAVATKSRESAQLGLDALACAHLANSFRARGNLREADPIMAKARIHALHADVSDRMVLAELDEYEGVLRQNQSRFEEAGRLLTGAASRYRRSERRVPLVRSLIHLAHVQGYEGDPIAALETLEEATALINPAEEPKLYLCAQHNTAMFLLEAGRPREARELLEESRPLYARNEGWAAVREAWLEGRIARALGEHTDAERHFKQVIVTFAKTGNGYDAALASLDLAELYLAAGKPSKLQAVAKGVALILRAEELHREAVTAILLFQKALATEQVSHALLEHVRSYLEEARNNPGLRFEPSS